MPRSPYTRLLAMRPVRRPLLGVIVGRLPLAAGSLATVLLVRGETGSFAVAGVVEAAVGIAAAISLPMQGRLVDRFGQTGILAISAIAEPLALVGLVATARAGATPAVLCLLGAASGAAIPPLSQCMRTLWSSLVADADLRQSAFALDAVLLETAFIAGPLGTALLVATASPAAAVLANAGLAAIGTAVFASSQASRRWRGRPRAGGRLGPAASPAIAALLAVELADGFAIGAMELSATAFATQHGSPSSAGALIAVQAAASLTGGLLYGSRPRSGAAAARFPALIAAVALGFAPLALAGSIGSLFPLMALSGLAFAPSAAVVYSLIDDLAPAGMATEASAWLTMALVAGFATGNAVAGPVVGGGQARLGFILAAAAAFAAWLIAVRSRPRWLA